VERMHHSGIEIGDLLADSGYAYRVAERWALPVRQLGAGPPPVPWTRSELTGWRVGQRSDGRR